MEELLLHGAAAVLLLLFSAVLFYFGRRMRLGTLKPNSLAGIRTPRSFRSEESWYAEQSRCAPYVQLMALIFLDSSILILVYVFVNVFITSFPFWIPAILITAQMVVGVILLCRAAIK